MDLSEFMNIILGGGLVGTVATIGSFAGYCEKSESGSDEGRGRCRGHAHR